MMEESARFPQKDIPAQLEKGDLHPPDFTAGQLVVAVGGYAHLRTDVFREAAGSDAVLQEDAVAGIDQRLSPPKAVRNYLGLGGVAGQNKEKVPHSQDVLQLNVAAADALASGE